MSSLRSFLIASIGCCSLLPGFGETENLNNENQVKVVVRTIMASEEAKATSLENSNPSVDKDLDDIKSKLAALPYHRFKMIGSKESEVMINGKETMSLPNGQMLAFRPVYIDDKRVGLWLNWKDSAGSEILNTRIHFDCNQAVLTGTDSTHETGLILAIQATPLVQSN